MEYLSDQDMPKEQPPNLEVLPLCVFRGEKVQSDADPVPWATWVERLQQGRRITGRAQAAHSKAEESSDEEVEVALVEKFP
eukprot:5139196-Lingulodinium_polyedra.AAC.1